tara:strand:- start:6038 stop:6385 length:348 start_codon:yes stop_codon:yes gene_type:complete
MLILTKSIEMKNSSIYISVLPLILILIVSFSLPISEKSEAPIKNELNVSQQTIDNLILESGVEIPSCTQENTAQFDCPCGGHCESDPGNVCTFCSELETQMKFVKCDSQIDPGNS